MTNKEWLGTLSADDFLMWLYSDEAIEFGTKLRSKPYFPTLKQIGYAQGNYVAAVYVWLEQERK